MKTENEKSIEFFQEMNELTQINLNDVRGGQALSSYDTGCPGLHHMAYSLTTAISVN